MNDIQLWNWDVAGGFTRHVSSLRAQHLRTALLTYPLARFQRRWWHPACWEAGLHWREACVSAGYPVTLKVKTASAWWKAVRPPLTSSATRKTLLPASSPRVPLSRIASVGPCEKNKLVTAFMAQLSCLWVTGSFPFECLNNRKSQPSGTPQLTASCIVLAPTGDQMTIISNNSQWFTTSCMLKTKGLTKLPLWNAHTFTVSIWMIKINTTAYQKERR